VRVERCATGRPKATDREARATGPDPSSRRLLDALQLLARRFSIAERADVECCGLTVAQSATLEVLRAEGPLRLSALGRRLWITPSTLTRNLARLEAAGLVAQETDPADGRAARVRLTPAGCEAAVEVGRREEEFARGVLARVPEERRIAALDGLNDLLLAVRDATEDCCSGAFEHLMTDIPGCCPGPPERGRDGDE
jgi:DNA-binding MarR family transcriptional regulator